MLDVLQVTSRHDDKRLLSFCCSDLDFPFILKGESQGIVVEYTIIYQIKHSLYKLLESTVDFRHILYRNSR